MNINDRAKKIVEERRKAFEINDCIHKILDVFEASNDMELNVWEVLLGKVSDEDNVKCYVRFVDDVSKIYHNRDQLSAVYNELGVTQNLMKAIEELDNTNITTNIVNDVFEFLINHPLDFFEISNATSMIGIRIKINQNAICEKKDIAQ